MLHWYIILLIFMPLNSVMHTHNFYGVNYKNYVYASKCSFDRVIYSKLFHNKMPKELINIIMGYINFFDFPNMKWHFSKETHRNKSLNKCEQCQMIFSAYNIDCSKNIGQEKICCMAIRNKFLTFISATRDIIFLSCFFDIPGYESRKPIKKKLKVENCLVSYLRLFCWQIFDQENGLINVVCIRIGSHVYFLILYETTGRCIEYADDYGKKIFDMMNDNNNNHLVGISDRLPEIFLLNQKTNMIFVHNMLSPNLPVCKFKIDVNEISEISCIEKIEGGYLVATPWKIFYISSENQKICKKIVSLKRLWGNNALNMIITSLFYDSKQRMIVVEAHEKHNKKKQFNAYGMLVGSIKSYYQPFLKHYFRWLFNRSK